QVLAKN
ncbi:putative ABC transporter, permease domain protein, partial [Vibrio parahaemolyticus V-223/04]